MWSVGPDRIDLYLGEREAGVAVRGRQLAWTAHDDVARAAAVCCGLARDAVGSRWRWPRLRVWLSGRLAFPFLLTPPAGLSSWSELERLGAIHARRLLASRDGRSEVAGPAAAAAVQVEAWSGQGAALCVGCDQTVVAQVLGTLDPRWSLSSIRPWWAVALDRGYRKRRRVGLFTAEDSDARVLLACDEAGRWRSGECILMGPDPLDARSRLMRKMVSLDADPAAMLSVRLDPTRGIGSRQPWVAVVADPDAL